MSLNEKQEAIVAKANVNSAAILLDRSLFQVLINILSLEFDTPHSRIWDILCANEYVGWDVFINLTINDLKNLQYNDAISGNVIKFKEFVIKLFTMLHKFITYLDANDVFDVNNPCSWTHSMWTDWQQLARTSSIHCYYEMITEQKRNFVGPLITTKYLKQFHFKKEEKQRIELEEKSWQEKYIVRQQITNNNISDLFYPPVKKIRELLPTYSDDSTSMYFRLNLHLDQYSPMENPHDIGWHHSKANPPVHSTLTTSNLEPDLPQSKITFNNFEVSDDVIVMKITLILIMLTITAMIIVMMMMTIMTMTRFPLSLLFLKWQLFIFNSSYWRGILFIMLLISNSCFWGEFY